METMLLAAMFLNLCVRIKKYLYVFIYIIYIYIYII